MPALFSKEDILRDDEKEAVIKFSDLYEIPEGVADPTITIAINDKTREAQKKASRKFLQPRIIQKNDVTSIIPPGKTLEYVMSVISSAFVSQNNFIDEYSQPIMRKQLSRSRTATKFLAEKITEAFEDDGLELKKEEDEDEKN